MKKQELQEQGAHAKKEIDNVKNKEFWTKMQGHSHVTSKFI